jgi:hypothetical protein
VDGDPVDGDCGVTDDDKVLSAVDKNPCNFVGPCSALAGTALNRESTKKTKQGINFELVIKEKAKSAIMIKKDSGWGHTRQENRKYDSFFLLLLRWKNSINISTSGQYP